MPVMTATVTKKVVIRYSADIVDQPITCQLVKKYDLDFNILKARIFPRREGVMVLELSGTKENFDAGVRFMKEKGLRVEPLSKSVTQNTDKCVHCGLRGFLPHRGPSHGSKNIENRLRPGTLQRLRVLRYGMSGEGHVHRPLLRNKSV
jgi:hypothetical protein